MSTALVGRVGFGMFSAADNLYILRHPIILLLILSAGLSQRLPIGKTIHKRRIPRVQHGKVQRPEHPAGLRKRYTIRQRHETKVHQLRDWPDLPVCNNRVSVQVLVFLLYLTPCPTLHHTHGPDEEDEAEGSHDNLVSGDALE